MTRAERFTRSLVAMVKGEMPTFSFEFFPPKDDAAAEQLWEAIRRLEKVSPSFVSITYGAGGTTRDRTVRLTERVLQETSLTPLAHLTCVGESRESLQNLIRHFVSLGVRGVLALRGDLPTDPEDWRGEFPFARYLIELIREVETDHSAALAGGRLGVGVAAYPIRHPESPSFEHDVEVLLAKERSGANYAITQVYFRANEYTNLVESARRAGVTIPIIPGVIPLNSVRRLNRLASMAGIAPDPILAHALETAGSESERHRIGVDAAVTLARRAFDDGAPGVHLYTFNDHRGSLDVIEQLELPRTRAQASNTWATRAAV